MSRWSQFLTIQCMIPKNPDNPPIPTSPTPTIKALKYAVGATISKRSKVENYSAIPVINFHPHPSPSTVQQGHLGMCFSRVIFHPRRSCAKTAIMRRWRYLAVMTGYGEVECGNFISPTGQVRCASPQTGQGVEILAPLYFRLAAHFVSSMPSQNK